MVSKNIVPHVEPRNHAEDGSLAKMEKCLYWEAASQEPDNRFWSCSVQLQEALHVLLEVSRDNGNFLDGEDQWGQAGEEHWYAI